MKNINTFNLKLICLEFVIWDLEFLFLLLTDGKSFMGNKPYLL